MKEVVTSRSAAMQLIEERIHEFRIDCDFKQVPWYLFTENDSNESYIQKEREAIERSGLPTMSLLL